MNMNVLNLFLLIVTLGWYSSQAFLLNTNFIRAPRVLQIKTSQSLTAINPKSSLQLNAFPPNLQLQSVSVFLADSGLDAETLESLGDVCISAVYSKLMYVGYIPLLAFCKFVFVSFIYCI